MAVVVQCFHCNAILELDDGFRGGVCRCSGCGSLLQVPRGDPASSPGRAPRPPRPASPPAPTGAGTPPRTAADTPDSGQSSGKLAPGDGTPSDLGGSSSGMGRVHRTRPISHVPMKSKRNGSTTSATRKTGPGSALREATASSGSVDRTIPIADRRLPQGRTPVWLEVLLLLAIAGVVSAMVYVYLFKP